MSAFIIRDAQGRIVRGCIVRPGTPYKQVLRNFQSCDTPATPETATVTEVLIAASDVPVK